jgi:predicted alpha/beta hydrolase
MKGSVIVEEMSATGMLLYARLCGRTLARAHARSGDPIAIAAYLCTDDDFDSAIADFSERYADQTETDFDAFLAAVKSGRLQAIQEA